MEIPYGRPPRAQRAVPQGSQGPPWGLGAPSGPQGLPWGQGAAETNCSGQQPKMMFSYFKPRRENALFEHQIFLVAWEKNRTLWRLGHPRAENVNPSTHEDEKCEPFGARGSKM